MKFRADEITSVIQREIEQFQAEVTRTEVGRVLEVGDGIARVHGLSGVMTSEMVEFENGVKGLAFNLEESSVGVIILGDFTAHPRGRDGHRHRRAAPGAGRRGHGRPRGQPARRADRQQGADPHRPHPPGRVAAPPASPDRQPVDEPLQTGIKAIDAMIPIGRGQRELIIGDRKTGKTAIAIDTILNQKGQGVICVYVAIAQKESTTASLVDVLTPQRRDGLHHRRRRRRQRPGPAAVPRPLRRLRDGRVLHVREGHGATLCVYDDLSKQAVAYRELSLLLRRPPGREAYPGDIFYAHSRLLERSAKLANKYVIVPDNAPTDDPNDPVTENWGVNGKVYLGVPGQEEAEHDLKANYADRPQGRQDGHLGRLADGPADHRDARRRGLGLHPDERDLDHRRPDLPPARPVLRRRPAGDRRRHQRLAAWAARPRSRP